MKESAQPLQTYHHGNLPETLTHEAAKLLAEKGIEGFSMREVACRCRGRGTLAPFRLLATKQLKRLELGCRVVGSLS